MRICTHNDVHPGLPHNHPHVFFEGDVVQVLDVGPGPDPELTVEGHCQRSSGDTVTVRHTVPWREIAEKDQDAMIYRGYQLRRHSARFSLERAP